MTYIKKNKVKMFIPNILLVLFVLITSVIGNAQECEMFSPTKTAVTLEYSSFDKDGNLQSKSKHIVKDVISEGSAMLVDIELLNYTKDGKKNLTTGYSAECQNGVFYMDMLRYFDMNKLATQESLDMEIEGTYLPFPKNMTESSDLQDGEVAIHISSNGELFGTMTMKITNRKMIGKEKITTPVGSFDCYKISHAHNSYFGNSTGNGTTTEWYAENIGVVKSESYNNQNVLISYTELTSKK